MTCQPFSRRSPQAGPDQAGRGRPWLARAVYGVLIIEIALVIWYAIALPPGGLPGLHVGRA